jgi:ribosomal protein S16
MPLLGAVMRWGWVKCRACNTDKDHPYQQVARSSAEIAERARLADSKAPYKKEEPPNRANLERLAAATPTPTKQSSGISQERFDRLLDQVTKLTDQVTELLQENRTLRAQLKDSHNAPVVEVEQSPPRKPRKKRGTEDVASNSPKDKRALS